MSLKKIVKPLASLKLAVFVLLAIATLVAWGTIIEAKYNDAKTAQELVYHSWLSYSIFALLAINLIAVIIDRYPWKKHHISFITAHVGILTLLVGSLVTRYYGVDGSLSFEIGSKQNKISVPETDLVVYASMDGADYRPVFEQQIHFLSHPPTQKEPFVVPLPAGDLKIVDFYPYAISETKVVPNPGGGPAVRFQISNERVMQSEWIFADKKDAGRVNLGPATVILTEKDDFLYTDGNVLHLFPKNKDTLSYKVYSDRKKGVLKSGEVKAGGKFDLGWMNLQLRLLKYLPEGRQEFSFREMERASELTTSAIKFVYNDKEHWIGLNSLVRFFGESAMYVLTYGNRMLPLNFDLQLKDFKVGRYQGTMRASSYESLVYIPGEDREVLVSMNEPLHYKGYTFYQASFQEDDMGRPIASILSVNYDPGRWIKYIGSILIVFGSAHLFYRRWKQGRKRHV